MKLTNEQVWEAYLTLQALGSQAWPIIVGYKLAKLARALKGHYEDVNDSRTKLVTKYNTSKPGDPESVAGGTQAQRDFQTEWKPIADIEVDINFDIVKLPTKVSYSCEKCKAVTEKPTEVLPNVMERLIGFVEVEEVDTAKGKVT